MLQPIKARITFGGGADRNLRLHTQGMLLDVWTLNAGTPNWRERLARSVAAGADVITTETPRELARAAHAGPG